MKNCGYKNFISYIALILSVLLLISGCETVPEDNTKPALTSGIPAGAVTEEPGPDPYSVPDGELPAYGGLVISKVFGSGRNSTAACRNSFVELKNTGAEPLSLNGLALYYRTGKDGYTQFALPDVTLGTSESFLIKGASAPDYDASAEIIKIDKYDAEWSI